MVPWSQDARRGKNDLVMVIEKTEIGSDGACSRVLEFPLACDADSHLLVVAPAQLNVGLVPLRRSLLHTTTTFSLSLIPPFRYLLILLLLLAYHP